MKKMKENKGMETLLKFLIPVVGVAGAAAIVFGINTYKNSLENEVRDLATKGPVIVEVKDNTSEKTETEELVDNQIYIEEAKKLWEQHSEKLVCSEEEFVEKYIKYRNMEYSDERAWDSLESEYAEENQIEFAENGEVVAWTEEMEAIMNSTVDFELVRNETMTEPTEEIKDEQDIEQDVEDIEQNVEVVDFVVNDIEPIQLYATQAVNVRKGPSADDFEKIGKLNMNQRVTVNGVVNTYKGETVLWYRIEGSKGNIGYVSGAYFAEKEVYVEEPKPVQPTPAPETPVENNDAPATNSGTNSVGGFTFNGGSLGFNATFGGQASADSGYEGNVRLD